MCKHNLRRSKWMDLDFQWRWRCVGIDSLCFVGGHHTKYNPMIPFIITKIETFLMKIRSSFHPIWMIYPQFNTPTIIIIIHHTHTHTKQRSRHWLNKINEPNSNGIEYFHGDCKRIAIGIWYLPWECIKFSYIINHDDAQIPQHFICMFCSNLNWPI